MLTAKYRWYIKDIYSIYQLKHIRNAKNVNPAVKKAIRLKIAELSGKPLRPRKSKLIW